MLQPVNLIVQKWNASARTLSEAIVGDTELTSLTSTTACRKTAIVVMSGFSSGW